LIAGTASIFVTISIDVTASSPGLSPPVCASVRLGLSATASVVGTGMAATK
jgi:hypothetical protein